MELLEATKEQRNDYDFVLKSVKINGNNLRLASKNLKNNYNIVLEAVKQNCQSLEYASKDLRSNYNMVLEAINHFDLLTYENGEFPLAFASKEIKDDYEIVKKSVKLVGYALLVASDRLKSDYNLLYHALTNVKKNGGDVNDFLLELEISDNIYFSFLEEESEMDIEKSLEILERYLKCYSDNTEILINFNFFDINFSYNLKKSRKKSL
jgi:hypothetical protein